LKADDRNLQQKKLLKSVMQKWLPADEALLEMMVLHLPSPATAQRYRVENLYTGPMDDITANAIRNCDPKHLWSCTYPRWCPQATKEDFLLLVEFLPEQSPLA